MCLSLIILKKKTYTRFLLFLYLFRRQSEAFYHPGKLLLPFENCVSKIISEL
jgi:hypothetical protein